MALEWATGLELAPKAHPSAAGDCQRGGARAFPSLGDSGERVAAGIDLRGRHEDQLGGTLGAHEGRWDDLFVLVLSRFPDVQAIGFALRAFCVRQQAC